MNSRSWGPVEAPGDGQEVARGTVGTDAAATPIGGTRVVIATAALMLTLLCVGLAIEAGLDNGLMLLATIFAAVYAWAIGAHKRIFWTR